MYKQITNAPGMVAIQSAELRKMIDDAYQRGRKDEAEERAKREQKEKETAKKNGKTAKAKVKTTEGLAAEFRSTVAEKKQIEEQEKLNR